MKKNSVRKSFLLDSVNLTSLNAKMVVSLKLIFSISFSIGGSGTHLNVNRENPNHQIPEVAKQNLADYIDVFCDKGFFTAKET